jgi:hypothetical protein
VRGDGAKHDVVCDLQSKQNQRRITVLQSRQIIVSGVALAIILSHCGMGLVPLASAQNFQKVLIFLQGSESLPKELLSGPNYLD